MSDSATGIRAMLQVVRTASPDGTIADGETDVAPEFATGGVVEGELCADELRHMVHRYSCVIDCRS